MAFFHLTQPLAAALTRGVAIDVSAIGQRTAIERVAPMDHRR